MNPRQRRGVLLMIISGALAVGVFAWVVGYVNGVRREVGSLVTVLRLKADLPPLAVVSLQAVEPVAIPARWAPATALHDTLGLNGMVAATALHKGSYVESDMLMSPPELQPGQREIAVLVDAETGVAGKISRGSTVDIYATFPAQTPQNSSPGLPERAMILVSDARILDVGNVESITGANGSGGVDQSRLVPVTFALSSTDALAVVFAESFATKFRLALIGPGDTTIVPPSGRSFSLQVPPAGATAPSGTGP